MKILWFSLFLAGCSTTPGTYIPPVTIGAGFLGAQVSVGLGGYTIPAKVVPSNDVKEATVLVPANAPVTTGTVPVTTSSGTTASVPVAVGPVDKPVVLVPAK